MPKTTNPADAIALESLAREIFTQKVNNLQHSRNVSEELAEAAFADAAVFCKVAAARRARETAAS